MFRLLRPYIVGISAKLIGEHTTQVEPFVTNRVAQTAYHGRISVFIEHRSVCLAYIFGNILLIVAISIPFVCVELWRTRFRVNAGKFDHIKGAVRLSDLVNLISADDLSL